MGRKRIYALVAVAIGLVFWLFAWPVLGPVVFDSIPLPGTNEVSAVEVNRTPDGRWIATVTYFYTGRPEYSGLRLTLVGDPQEANGRIDQQYVHDRPAIKGTHAFSEEISRPTLDEPVAAKQLLVEMISGPAGVVTASKRIARDMDWPDRTTWDLDQEIARTSRDSVVARASALTQSGDTASLVKARAIVRRLVAKDPKFQPAIDLSVRIAEKAIWERDNVGRLRTDTDIKNQVRVLGNAGGFQELDELAANLRETKARTADGLSALSRFHAALYQGGDGVDMNPRVLQAEERYDRRWLKFRPDSSTAQLLLAENFIGHAWQIRGGGYASSVSEAQWKGFKDWNMKAQQVLAKCFAACGQDPQWYVLMLSVMPALSADNEVYLRTFVDGFERFPEYDPISQVVAERMAPRWGGSVERFESFAREVASKFPGDTRDMVYARIYTSAAYFQNSTTQPRFAEWKVDCPRLMRGHDQIVSKYPTEYNFNVAAFMASQCQDRRALRRYLALVGDKPDMLQWGDSAEHATSAYARAAALAR